MGRLTFRVDDGLIREIDNVDSSRSEVMREALDLYLLDQGTSGIVEPSSRKILSQNRAFSSPPLNINITISREDGSTHSCSVDSAFSCKCSTDLRTDWTFCPNCGRRVNQDSTI